jgi:hypothetical protein|tara:strand:- start:1950 stop:2591 length:642 start_codon:yes stop_codon:yes gene_type:complete
MAYLDNNTITINAVLTKKGREVLAKTGGLNITAFALADDEIDYSQYNPTHPKGSSYYDVALRNTPVMEPITDESQTMKYKLVTLNEGVSSVPTISVAQSTINVDRDYSGEILISPSTNPTYNVTLGYTAILSNKTVGTLVVTETNSLDSTSATIPTFAGDLGTQTSQAVVGNKFRFIPNATLSKTTTTNITIVGNESGGNTSILVTVKVPTTS